MIWQETIYILAFILFIYISEFLGKIIVYFKYIKGGIMASKGAIYVWFINFFPLMLFLINNKKFIFINNLKSFFKIFSIIQFLLFPFLFINSTITYRLLIYFFPASIYISSYLPEIVTSKNKKMLISSILIFFAYLSLAIWNLHFIIMLDTL